MNYLDLFHGIGGFALGAYWAGMKFDNHFCSDIEKYTIELYKKRFPDSIQLGDITKIDFEKLKKDYPDEWIITGGFPCQDISVAGKGKGLIDEKGNKTRSGLWFDYWRAIRTLRPRFVIIENVRALLNRGMETVLANLAEIGYNAEWQIISAEDMGAPHKRERVWILAYPQGIGNRHDDDKGDKRKSSDRQKWPKVGSNINFGSKSTGEIPNSIGKYDDNSGHGASPIFRKRSKEAEIQGSLSNSNSKRKQKFNFSKIAKEKKFFDRTFNENERENCWKSEPSICRVVNGISNELDGYQGRLTNKSYKRVDKLKGLGNSIVPQIAELLFRQIKNYLQESSYENKTI